MNQNYNLLFLDISEDKDIEEEKGQRTIYSLSLQSIYPKTIKFKDPFQMIWVQILMMDLICKKIKINFMARFRTFFTYSIMKHQ